LLRKAGVEQLLEHWADGLADFQHRLAAHVAADMTQAVGALRNHQIIIIELEKEEQIGIGLARTGPQHIAQGRQAVRGQRAPGRVGGKEALGADLDRDVGPHPILDVRARAAIGDAALAAAGHDDCRLQTWRASQGAWT